MNSSEIPEGKMSVLDFEINPLSSKRSDTRYTIHTVPQIMQTVHHCIINYSQLV